MNQLGFDELGFGIEKQYCMLASIWLMLKHEKK